MRIPYFIQNPKCYYKDPRVTRYKVRDAISKKELESYLSYYSQEFPDVPYEKICEKVKQDYLEYVENKDRYTFDDHNTLVAIDGKPIVVDGDKIFNAILKGDGGFLD